MKKLLWTAVVAATAPAPRRGIGLQGGLPWKIPGDLKHFRTITSRTKDPAKRNAVVMGRLTWESSEVKCRPLPKRLNVVISTTLAPREDDNVVIVPSLDAAVALMGTPKYTDTIETVHIVGGGQIYAEALKKRLCDYVYLTEIFLAVECDAFLPDENIESFGYVRDHTNTEIPDHDVHEENGFTYQFQAYKRGPAAAAEPSSSS